MNLLFITQKVDKKDDVLGVYHEWIRGLADRYSHVSVVCLYRGEVDLPDNVSVYSLGKEEGGASAFSRLRYVLRFYRYLWKLRGRYSQVFVHMNKEYVVLAGLWWKLSRIPVLFWYNHPKADVWARLAMKLSRAVFYTSPYAASSGEKNAHRMPVGILVPAMLRSKDSRSGKVVYVGRISKVKRVDVLLDAARKLSAGYPLRIIGDPVDRKEDLDYFTELKDGVQKSGALVSFEPGVSHARIPEIFESADLSVNLTDTGSMDKTIFESFAAGCPVVTSNPAVLELVPEKWRRVIGAEKPDSASVAEAIERVFALSDEEYALLRHDLFRVAQSQSLDVLLEKLPGNW